MFKRRYHHKVMFVILLLFLLFFSLYKGLKANDYITDKFLVTEVKNFENNNRYTIKKGLKSYIFYSDDLYKVGNKLFVKGEVKGFEKYYTPGSFDRNKYYRSNGIFGEVISYEITDLNKNSLIYSFQNLIKDPLLKVFLGIEKLEDEHNYFSSLNIYHLISLSGIHVYLLLTITAKIMFYFNIEMKKQDIIKLLIVISLLLVSGFKTTMIRICIYQLLKYFKRHYYGNVTNFTLLNLSFLMVILIRPYLMMNLSYLVTYLIIISISLFRELISSSNLFIQQIKTSFLVNLVSMPFYSKVNLLSILLSPIYYLLIVNVMFPLSIINNIISFPLINKINSLIFKTVKVTNIEVYSLNLFKLSKYLVLAYLLILGLVLISKHKKRFLSVILLMLILITPGFKRYISGERFYFLDVGQGDSSVYLSNDLVIVADAFRNVKTFLEYEGVRKIDYLIITHNHQDHMMELDSLITNFKVVNIVVSPHVNLDLKTNINIIEASSNTIIKERDLLIKFYGPIKDYYNDNNNSLVFKIETLSKSVLYTGDIEKKAERDLVNMYGNELKSDYLMVSHHGSNTSSLKEFVLRVDPLQAIISLGRNNYYGFPSFETTETFNDLNINVLRTDLLGTIMINNYNQIIKYKK